MNKKEAVNEVKELLNPNGEEICIKQKIYEIRNCQVMIDKDLAFLYGVETKVLNQAVKRNIERFPSDFHFQLTMEECLRSQIVTLNEERGKHLKYLPYAFTENGIAMLSSVLRSPAAIEMNIRIMRIFTSMRRLFANDILLNHRLSNLEFHQVEIDKRLDYISKKIENKTKVLGIFKTAYDTREFKPTEYEDLARQEYEEYLRNINEQENIEESEE